VFPEVTTLSTTDTKEARAESGLLEGTARVGGTKRSREDALSPAVSSKRPPSLLLLRSEVRREDLQKGISL